MKTRIEMNMDLADRLKSGVSMVTPAIISGKCSEDTVQKLLAIFKHVGEHGTLPEPPAASPPKPSVPPAPAKAAVPVRRPPNLPPK